jgi:ribonuclease E
VITVEMTPDEQRIYALMGISPLVLANEEVQEPRNTVISVVLPGEAPTSLSSPNALAVADSLAEQSTFPEDVADETSQPSKVIPVKEASSGATVEQPILANRTPENEPVEASMASESEIISPSSTSSDDSSDSSAVRRRRRRRSSASSDNGEE